jgi:hypothetical protein
LARPAFARPAPPEVGPSRRRDPTSAVPRVWLVVWFGAERSAPPSRGVSPSGISVERRARMTSKAPARAPPRAVACDCVGRSAQVRANQRKSMHMINGHSTRRIAQEATPIEDSGENNHVRTKRHAAMRTWRCVGSGGGGDHHIRDRNAQGTPPDCATACQDGLSV